MTYQIVDTDDDTLESAIRVAECLEPVLVRHDSGENTLVDRQKPCTSKTK